VKEFFKSAFRHIFHNKVYATINIAGLAIGIGCGLVIYKIISYESGFDSYHKNYLNIYRLINEYNDPVLGLNYDEAQVHPLGKALKNDFPGIDAVMCFYAAKGQITIENKDGTSDKFMENSGLAYAEPDLFNIFDFQFLAGDPSKALLNKGSMVISSSLAQKYFKLSPRDVDEALGRLIIINNKTSFQITGIISDPPDNTDLPFKIIADYSSQTASNPYFNGGTDWNEYNSATNCYLLLPDGISAKDFEKQLVTFFPKYNDKKSGLEYKYVLQPLSELHSGKIDNYNHRQTSKKKLLILGIIGLFLILIASFNFVILSTAQAADRFKEIRIRKIFGAGRFQLILQFLGESIMLSYIATAFAGLLIAHFVFVYIKDIIGYKLSPGFVANTDSLIFLIFAGLVVGLLSGLYPSLTISGRNPSRSLKTFLPTKNKPRSQGIRNALVIIQLLISQLLIIGTIVMDLQMSYFLKTDLGFNKDAILISTLPGDNIDKLKVIKDDLLKNPGIEMVSFGTRSPLANWKVNNEINYPTLEKDIYFGNLKTADEDYFKLFRLKFIAGENYSSRKNTGDAVVNRKMTRLLGFEDPHDAIGKKFKYGRDGTEFTIVGVLEDFHSESLQNPMDNVIFSNLSFNIKEMAVKFSPARTNLNNTKETIDRIKAEWAKLFPDNIFNYSFFDEQIANMYGEEERAANLVQLFAFIAIAICCLGLFGLTSYIANQKIKEIGIRRINGAKAAEILITLNKNLLIMEVIAFVIACPIAWIIMHKWLQTFAYRTGLSWWIFVLSGIFAFGIALLTVSWQSWRAATRNPADTLRYE